jgi:hypothetical protein
VLGEPEASVLGAAEHMPDVAELDSERCRRMFRVQATGQADEPERLTAVASWDPDVSCVVRHRPVVGVMQPVDRDRRATCRRSHRTGSG